MPYFPNASLYYVGLSDAGPNDKNNEPSLSLSLFVYLSVFSRGRVREKKDKKRGRESEPLVR